MRGSEGLPRDRLADLVSAASYGSVLVVAALGVIGVTEIDLGQGAELVAGVGVATWIAHLFAELLGGHVEQLEPLHRDEVRRALIDGSPILASTAVPALVLLLGRVDLIGDTTAKSIAILVAVAQLLAIGAFVGRVAPACSSAGWIFAAVTAGIGVAIVVLTVLLGH